MLRHHLASLCRVLLVSYVHFEPVFAQGDAFCNGLHFDDINKALASVGEEPLDWLPSVGWDKGAKAADVASASLKMGQFMSQTMDLHKMYLERLENVSGEKAQELSAIHGIMDLPVVDLGSATLALVSVIPSMAALVERCVSFARKTKRAANISLDEVAALHLYTLGSAFYRKLNEALRDPSRTTIHLYFGYLRLFFSAVSKLNAYVATHQSPEMGSSRFGAFAPLLPVFSNGAFALLLL